MPQLDSLQIGEVAKRAGVSVRTVRYYEERGLLSPAARTSGGVRLYGDAQVARLRFIRRLQALGLSLGEIETALGGEGATLGRDERVARSLEILSMEQKRVEEQLVAINQLAHEVEEALANVRVCATCREAECPETCLRRGHLL